MATLSFDINLPVVYDYWPVLTATVFDQVLKGLAQPVLGTFSINLYDCYKYFLYKKKKIAKDIEDLQNNINETKAKTEKK